MTQFAKETLPISLEEEMRRSYLDYAMSVIVARALPDGRDGLKPVHRRILYSMHENGHTPDKKYVKSARVVGDVMGKYHPHGDQAIYDALARMAQDFSLRYPLVDGHGNFGSPDPMDRPAAARYTEAKLAPLAMQLLGEIDEDTVDMVTTYDGGTTEPSVLPARYPNLLVNGGGGIAAPDAAYVSDVVITGNGVPANTVVTAVNANTGAITLSKRISATSAYSRSRDHSSPAAS